jgi:hypothetical protein
MANLRAWQAVHAGIGDLQGFLEGLGLVLGFLQDHTPLDEPSVPSRPAAASSPEAVMQSVAPADCAAAPKAVAIPTGGPAVHDRLRGSDDDCSSSGSDDDCSGRGSSIDGSAHGAGSSSGVEMPEQEPGPVPPAVAACLESGAGMVRMELPPPPQQATEQGAQQGIQKGTQAATCAGSRASAGTLGAEGAVTRVARIASRLAVCAVGRGWPALTATLLPVAALGRR